MKQDAYISKKKKKKLGHSIYEHSLVVALVLLFLLLFCFLTSKCGVTAWNESKAREERWKNNPRSVLWTHRRKGQQTYRVTVSLVGWAPPDGPGRAGIGVAAADCTIRGLAGWVQQPANHSAGPLPRLFSCQNHISSQPCVRPLTGTSNATSPGAPPWSS